MAAGSFYGMINLSWTIPSTRYGNHALTRIYRSEKDNFANAELIGAEGGAVFSDFVRDDALTPDDKIQLKGYYYWIAFVSTSGVEGPPNSPAGTFAQPMADMDYVLDLIDKQINESHLAGSLRDDIELITAPESIEGSVASRVAEERDARIAGLKGAHDAVDDEASERTASINVESQARRDADLVLSTQLTELSVRVEALPVFSSGFEPGSDFDQWSGDATSSVAASADAYTGLQAGLITSSATIPGSVAGGAVTTVPEEAATAFAGRRVRVSGYAKQPDAGASSEFAVAYSTGGEDSGWQSFAAEMDWTAFEFLYDVPAESALATDALAIWGDTSGGGNGTLIDAISVESATSEVPEFTAALQAEQQARTDGDAALASDILSMTAIASDNAADIYQESQVRASADEALATDIQSNYAQFGELRGEIVNESIVRAREDDLLAGVQRVISAAGETQSASISTLSEIRITEHGVVVRRVDDLRASMDDAEAAIQTEEAARVDADSALAQQITTVHSDLQGETSERESAVSTVQENLNSESSRLDGRIDTTAQAVTTAQSQLGDDISQVQTNLTTTINRVDGELESIGALYTAKVSVNGLIGGFGIYNDGTEIDAGFDVDRFWVGRTDDEKRKPFIIDGDTTYMDEAMIRQASIQEGQLGPITIGKLEKSDGTPVTTVGGLIRADAIDVNNLSVAEAAKFSGDAFSDNYSPGNKGWVLRKSGFAELNEAVIRGNLEIKSITVNGNPPSGGISKNMRGRSESLTITGNGTKTRTLSDKTFYVSKMPKNGSLNITAYPRITGSGHAERLYYYATAVFYAHFRTRVWVDGNKVIDDNEKTWDGFALPRQHDRDYSHASKNSGLSTHYKYPSYKSSSKVRVLITAYFRNKSTRNNSSLDGYRLHVNYSFKGHNAISGDYNRLG